MIAVVIRSLERVFIILAGVLSIYLGYLLFLHIPNEVNSQGQVILPGGISIYLSRVGPGAFLALFGAIVVAMSFRYSIRYSEKEEIVSRTESRKAEREYSGFGSSSPSINTRKLDLERQVLHMDILDNLPSLVKTNLPDDQKSERDDLIKKIKLALMKSVWGPDWGDFDEFQAWVENGTLEPPPAKLKKAADYYKVRGAIP